MFSWFKQRLLSVTQPDWHHSSFLHPPLHPSHELRLSAVLANFSQSKKEPLLSVLQAVFFWPVLSNVVLYFDQQYLFLPSIGQYCPVLRPATVLASFIECQSSPPACVNFYCWESLLQVFGRFKWFNHHLVCSSEKQETLLFSDKSLDDCTNIFAFLMFSLLWKRRDIWGWGRVGWVGERKGRRRFLSGVKDRSGWILISALSHLASTSSSSSASAQSGHNQHMTITTKLLKETIHRTTNPTVACELTEQPLKFSKTLLCQFGFWLQ